jgi:hypothetical protein
MNRFFYWIIRHPIWVLSIIGIITLGFGAAALTIDFSTDLQDLLPPNDSSVVNFIEMSKSYGSQDYLLIAVHDDDTVFAPKTLKLIWDLTQAAQELPAGWVEEVRSIVNAEVVEGQAASLVVRPALDEFPESQDDIAAFRELVLDERLLSRLLLSEDERTTLIILEERPEIINSDAAHDLSAAVENLVEPYLEDHQIYLSGGPYIIAQVRESMLDDLRNLIPAAMGVLLLVLYLSFRQIRGMVLPVIVAALSVIWTLGVMALMGLELTMVSVVVPIILIAIADADSIHVLTHFQEMLHRYRSKHRALLRTMGKLNQPVIFTSLSSAAGFLGLATAYSLIVQNFGIATSIGILFAMIISLTFLPAILALMPAKTAKHLKHKPLSWIHGRRQSNGQQHLRWVYGAAIIFFISILGIFKIEINNNPVDYVRADLPVSQSAHFIEDTFGGSLTLRISFTGNQPDLWKDPQWLEKIQALQRYLESLEYTGVSTSIVDVLREINVSLHEDDPAFDVIPPDIRQVAQSLLLFDFGGGGSLESLVQPNYAGGQVTVLTESLPLKLLGPMVASIESYVEEHFPDSNTILTGQPMFGLRLGETLIPSQMSSLALSLLLVWGMLLILTRSLRLSLISMVPLVFAVVVMFATMGFIGIPIDLGTMMVASVAIGIGVDFAIHFISQYQQARKTRGPERSVHSALDLTWRALLYNTLSLGLGFSVMLFSQFNANIAFGGLMGLTVTVAFVCTLRLVPALLLLTSRVDEFKIFQWFKSLSSPKKSTPID